MQKKILGSTDLKIAPLVFGGNVFGWTADETRSFELLDCFVDNAFNLIDTADVYSVWTGQGGISETIIGKWLKQSGKRDKILIASKVGMQMTPNRKGLSKQHILRSVDESLSRLQTDHIDLYQAHEDDAQTPFEESLEAFDSLIKAGKVRFIGASNYNGERLSQALTCSQKKHLAPYRTLQPHYNLYDRQNYETDLESLALDRKLGVIPYYSLAKGFLTGKYRSEADLGKSPRGGGVKSYMNERGFRILAELDRLAKFREATPAQISLAWLIARPSVVAPIASATSLEQLKDLMQATRLKLSPEDIKALDQASRYD